MRRIRFNLTTIEDMAAYSLFGPLHELFDLFRTLISEGYDIILFRSFSDLLEENQEMISTAVQLNEFIPRFIPEGF